MNTTHTTTRRISRRQRMANAAVADGATGQGTGEAPRHPVFALTPVR